MFISTNLLSFLILFFFAMKFTRQLTNLLVRSRKPLNLIFCDFLQFSGLILITKILLNKLSTRQ